MAVPERIAWAVEQVRPRPGVRVLEIGYGHGFAVDLLCSAGALVTGVDRSPTMLAAASRRNADCTSATSRPTASTPSSHACGPPSPDLRRR